MGYKDQSSGQVRREVLDRLRYLLGDGGGRIVREIHLHILENGGSLSDWYVGITNDPKRRRSQHKVKYDDSTWIAIEAKSADVARKVEKHFIDRPLGCKGGGGGGDEGSRYVYAYKKVRRVSFIDTLINRARTFNIYPQYDSSYHLKKANIAKSDFEALSSDWDNVSRDLSITLLKGSLQGEENRKVEG